MKLKSTDRFIKRGIEMWRLKNYNFFMCTHEYKTVYDLEEATVLTTNG